MTELNINEYYIKVKGIKEKTICHFSDCHLAEYDSLSTNEEVEKAKLQSERWLSIRESFAKDYNQKYGENEKKPAMEHFETLLMEAQKHDVLVMTGDILDYISQPNIRVLENRMKNFPVPYVYVCGNHEHTEQYPDGLDISRIKRPVQEIDLGDVLLLGIDNSKSIISKEQFDYIKDADRLGKKIIVAMHLPFATKDNVPIQEHEYFKFNKDGCPQINLDFMDFIASSKNVIAVLCGHLHFENISDLSENVTQYVVSQGIAGNVNIYHIGE